MKRLSVLALSVFTFAASAAVDPDLMPVRVSGLGLGALPDALKPRLRVLLFLSGDERDAFPDMPPEDKFRFFATNETEALPLGGGGAELLDLTGETCPWLGSDSATLWVEGRVHGASASLATEVSLDDAVIGRDAIRIRVAPFLVLSNCDVAEKLFYANLGTPEWAAFALDVTNAVEGFLPAVETPHAPFPQDVAELGWSGIGASGTPAVWSMERNGFKEVLAAGVGVFTSPAVSKMGGNVEATPPTDLHPHGRVVVGSNLPEEAKAFLRAQEVQAPGGELIELPVSWLRVGHVDEVMAIVPSAGDNGFSVLVGDLGSALELLREEIALCQEWLDDNPGGVDVQHVLDVLSEKIEPYENPANASLTNLVSSNLSIVRTTLSSGLGLQDADLMRVPCLYPLPGVQATGWNNAEELWSNPINMVVLVNETGQRRVLVPDVPIETFAENILSVFGGLGYDKDEIAFVDTTGPRGGFGEAHCASNAKRRRIP